MLRHFGSKEGLLVAAMADAEQGVVESRGARPGDAARSIRGLVGHYEEDGDLVLRWLSLADRYPLVRRVTQSGKQLHEAWVEEVFGPDLEALSGGERRVRKAVLASLTDVHVWALLRRQQGLGRRVTEAAMLDLVEHARGGRR
jgi:AcrR family transcriptional regulator